MSLLHPETLNAIDFFLFTLIKQNIPNPSLQRQTEDPGEVMVELLFEGLQAPDPGGPDASV